MVMATSEQAVRLDLGGAAAETVGDEPVSPTGQYFNSSVLSVCIICAFEFDIPIDDSPTMDVLKNLFLPINPRFSSIMVRDEHGVKQWKRVQVKLEEHVKVPVFPPGLSVESYEEHTEEYLTGIAMEQLPQHRPLWELHIIKYPTRGAEGTLVFKLHHALGDGFSLMGALFSCLRRADDHSLPLTFPARREDPAGAGEEGAWGRAWRAVRVGLDTAREFGWSLLKSNLVGDDPSPVRSGCPGVEFRPVAISSVTFPLDDIRRIKAKLGGTVNDVVTGIIFYGIQLYIQSQSKQSSVSELTALVLLNTRVINSYQTLKEMSTPNAESPWGNQFGFLHVSLPKHDDPLNANPLDFILEARETIKRKRSSLAVYLTGWLLERLRRWRGPEAAAKYIHATLRNTSMTISNMIGPSEQMHMANHPVRSFYFMVVSIPQSLTITMVSYMGKLRVAFGTEKDFIDRQLLISCMEKSFSRIFTEALGKLV
uniref:O-acyltransferase WSD1 n=1 Tax=Anthurium amnicola TaxID=1678845 RepID=A0A1D1YPJ0_9ARAE